MEHHNLERTAASARELAHIPGMTDTLAREIRAVWHRVESRQQARELIDELIGGYGIEYLGRDKRTRADMYYVNMGDPYVVTILFVNFRMFVGCWGDIVEANRLA